MAERLTAAIARARRWMEANGAKVLVENLAPGCTEEELLAAEQTLGFAIPTELRALWSLHNGQKEELNGFVQSYDLFGIRWALAERNELLDRYVRGNEDEDEDERSAEERSEHWIPFAGRDGEYLAVNADSGRVFWVGKDWPPFSERAASLAEWFEKYASGMEQGEYTVEEGFGDCYLQGS